MDRGTTKTEDIHHEKNRTFYYREPYGRRSGLADDFLRSRRRSPIAMRDDSLPRPL
jgi:hypothetical protein